MSNEATIIITASKSHTIVCLICGRKEVGDEQKLGIYYLRTIFCKSKHTEIGRIQKSQFKIISRILNS